MAGEADGKRTEKMRAVTEAVCGLVAALCALSFCTTEHCYIIVRQRMARRLAVSRTYLQPFPYLFWSQKSSGGRSFCGLGMNAKNQSEGGSSQISESRN